MPRCYFFYKLALNHFISCNVMAHTLFYVICQSVHPFLIFDYFLIMIFGCGVPQNMYPVYTDTVSGL